MLVLVKGLGASTELFALAPGLILFAWLAARDSLRSASTGRGIGLRAEVVLVGFEERVVFLVVSLVVRVSVVIVSVAKVLHLDELVLVIRVIVSLVTAPGIIVQQVPILDAFIALFVVCSIPDDRLVRLRILGAHC